MVGGQPNPVIRYLRRLAGSPPDTDRSDEELLRRFVLERSQDAFATLVDKHGPMVLGVCRRVLRNAQDVEDAFQATFLVLVRKAGSLRQPTLLASWLYGVAYRTAIKARALAHGCNCLGSMGAGIATGFRDRYPAMYAEYRRRVPMFIPVVGSSKRAITVVHHSTLD